MNLKDFFSRESFKNAIPWLLLLLGIFLFLYGEGFKTITIKGVCRFLSETIIIGALLGIISNAGFFSNIFKKEVQDIFYGNVFIGQKNDLLKIWSSISSQLCNHRFKDIIKSILNTIQSYLPDNAASYYDHYNIDLSLSWSDPNKGTVNIVQHLRTTVIAEDTKAFEIPFTTINPSNSACPTKVTKLTVNGKDYNCKSKKIPGTNNYECILKLQGASRYEIAFTRERKDYNIYKDNYIGFRSRHIINNMDVHLNLPDDIKYEFLSRGTSKDFYDQGAPNNGIIKCYKGIILPNQGYIIVLQPPVSKDN